MRVGDLFAGIGGFSLAAHWMGWSTAWFSEVNPYASAVLRKHWPHVPNHGDITRIKGDAVERVDLLCGGFPCQDISYAGKGAGIVEGERSGLWSHIPRLISEMQDKHGEAPWCLFENVAALKTRGLDVVLKDLSALGYDAEWHCIPASAVGAPHQRDRIWILAYPCGEQEQSVFAGCWPEGSGEAAPSWAVDFMDASRCARDAWRQAVANAAREQLEERFHVGGTCGGRAHTESSGSGACCGRGEDRTADNNAHVDDTVCSRLEGHTWNDGGAEWEATLGSIAATGLPLREDTIGWWAAEPDVGRVVNGLLSRLDRDEHKQRLTCLGNSIVPQLALRVFQQIQSLS